MVGVEVDVLHVAVLERDAELVRRRPVDVLGSEVADLISLLGPADQRAVEVGVLREPARFVGGGAEGILASLEGVHAPALLAVVRVDTRQSLEGDLGADLIGPLAHLGELGGDGEVVAAEERLAADLEVLHGRELLGPTARLEMAGDDFVDGHGGCGCGHRDGEKERREHVVSGRARILGSTTPCISRV